MRLPGGAHASGGSHAARNATRMPAPTAQTTSRPLRPLSAAPRRHCPTSAGRAASGVPTGMKCFPLHSEKVWSLFEVSAAWRWWSSMPPTRRKHAPWPMGPSGSKWWRHRPGRPPWPGERVRGGPPSSARWLREPALPPCRGKALSTSPWADQTPPRACGRLSRERQRAQPPTRRVAQADGRARGAAPFDHMARRKMPRWRPRASLSFLLTTVRGAVATDVLQTLMTASSGRAYWRQAAWLSRSGSQGMPDSPSRRRPSRRQRATWLERRPCDEVGPEATPAARMVASRALG